MTVTNFGWGVLLAVAVLAAVLAWRGISAWESSNLAWAFAFDSNAKDRNEKERENWIGANCELSAQNEILAKNVADLTCENDRLRDFMDKAKLKEYAEWREKNA